MPVPLPLAAPTPEPKPSCTKASAMCEAVWRETGNLWLAEGSYYFLEKPLTILLIVVLALVARFLLNRFITRMVRHATAEGRGGLFRRRSRAAAPAPAPEQNGLVIERRRQRAEALGSVLRSGANAVILVITTLTVLGELGINLAPLLTSASIVGVAVAFGAQNLVKDFLSGIFMLLEDQYGVGDAVEVGEVHGTVESVGLRVTTIRDYRGVIWYIRNGEIVRVGNKSQGWSIVNVDVPIGLADVEDATTALRAAAAAMAADEDWSKDLIEPPEVLGVESITTEGATLRTTVKTTSDAQARIARELRGRLTEALAQLGAEQAGGATVTVRPSSPGTDVTAGPGRTVAPTGSANAVASPGPGGAV